MARRSGFLQNLLKIIVKKLICTNPDLIVHQETKKNIAGAIAKIYNSLGGKVIYFVNLTKFMI